MKDKNNGNKLINLIRKTRIQTRLLITCLALSLVPALFVGVYAYNVYTASINTKLGETTQQLVQLLNNNLNTELKRFTDKIDSLSVNEVIQDALTNSARGDMVTREVAELMNDTLIGRDYLKSLVIANRDGNKLYQYAYEGFSDEQHTATIETLTQRATADSLDYLSTYRGNQCIVVGRMVYRFVSMEHIGYIYFGIDEALLHDAIYADLSYGENSNVLLFTGAGKILSSKEGALGGESIAGSELYADLLQAVQQGSSSFETHQDGQRFLAVYNYNRGYDTYFLALVPYSYITNETSQITTNLVIVILVLVLASLGLAMVLYLSIMQPIKKIYARCNVVADDDLDTPINDLSPDELGFLARTIDHIILELKDMAVEWQNDQQRKHELELEMLQYQINPHFLFNTLNTLKWVAVINEVPVLEEGISSLSLLLQSTLMRKDEYITIAEEVQNLRHYFSIQRIRHADCFDVEYDLNEAVLPRLTPRFILQPLAENAIIHGQQEEGRICITVHAAQRANGDVVLEIRDDGAGFDTSRLEGLAKRERFSGIGLNNVDERLRLHFGAGYGLTIRSEIGRGTVCSIVIPAGWPKKQPGSEEEANV